jgi:hypothetical protein
MGYIHTGLGSPTHSGPVARSDGILVGMPWKCNTLAGNTTGLTMWRLPTPDAKGYAPRSLTARVGASLPGATMDPELSALCLFFAHSPVRRHREWVLLQFEMNPEIERNSALTGLCVKPLWDSSGTDHAKGIEASLNLLGLCNDKIRAKMRGKAVFETIK